MIDLDRYREPYIQTERLTLEPLTAWHGESLFPHLKEPLLYTFIPREPPLATTILSRRFEKLETRRSDDGSELWLNWAVRLTANGYAGLVEATVRSTGVADIAYWVFLAHQKQGIGRESVAALLKHLAEIGVTQAAAHIDTRNTASASLAEALGFQRVATHRAPQKLRGRVVDDYEYREQLA